MANNQVQIAPYGSWRSPITAASLTSSTIGLTEPLFDGDDIYWIESRPLERGRSTIVKLSAGSSQAISLLPRPLNSRSKVNEYGGGSYCVHNGVIYFVLYDDQRIYRIDGRIDNNTTTDNLVPQPLTVSGPWRFADLIVDAARDRLIAVCEDHSRPGQEAQTYLATIPLSAGIPTAPQKWVCGDDFYSNPRLSNDGGQLCWLSWNHPNMPWDGCTCYSADVDAEGQLQNTRAIAGGPTESIFQPQWAADNSLYFVSDRSNWWNLYRYRQGEVENICPMEAEFASPHWVFGLSCYDFLDDSTLLCCYTEAGCWRLATIDLNNGRLSDIATELTDISHVRCADGCGIFVGASAQELPIVYRVDNDDGNWQLTALARSSQEPWDPGYLSTARAITYPTLATQTDDKTDENMAYGFFYPSQNKDFTGPHQQKPPLIVLCHGGPTAATHASLNLKIQFWTSRGFAVADLNYGGSTGYGRHYRQRLQGQWGIVDVQDAVAAVRYLVEQGQVDGEHVAIKGGSAGGFTVLAALTFADVFKAGASYYGIGDLETLARDTHKFESRYMDSLVGPYPQARDVYQARSPIHHVDGLNCPVIFFQGLEDKVVPPNQAEAMVNALKNKGLPVAYVVFPDEGHGFRQAPNIQRAIEAELYFYSRIFDFPLADEIEPVLINQLPQQVNE